MEHHQSSLLFELPTELLFEQLKYLSVDSIRRLYSTSKACSHLVSSFFESQRRTIKYCLVDADINIQVDKNPHYGPLEVISENAIDLGLNTFGTQFARSKNLRCNHRALAASDIVLIPFSWSTILFHGPKKIGSLLFDSLLSAYVLLGSPNIHLIIDGTMNNDMHKEAYLSWVPELLAAFGAVLGDKASHTKIIPINSHQKFQFNITEKSYDWYDGPTLRELLENSTKFRAPYSLKDILSPASMILMNPFLTKPLVFNLRGISENIRPLHGALGIVPPGEFGEYLYGPKRLPYAPPKIISNDKISTAKYGNCYCSLTVIKNQLRPRFFNEIYIAGHRFIIRVNLIAKVKDGERTLVLSANAGDQVEAIVTFMKIPAIWSVEYRDTNILHEYIPNEDPLHKNIFGKFVVRDHWEVVLVGTIKKRCELTQTERDKFFEEDTVENHEKFGRNYHRDEKSNRKLQKKLEAKAKRSTNHHKFV